MKANLTEGGHYYYYHSLGYFDWVYCHLTGIGSVHNCRAYILSLNVPLVTSYSGHRYCRHVYVSLLCIYYLSPIRSPMDAVTQTDTCHHILYD